MSDSSSMQINSKKEHWANLSEAGSYYGMCILLFIQKLFGRRAFSFVLYGVAAYFLIFRISARKASLEYLITRWDWLGRSGPKPGLKQVYSHFICFGEVVLDKLLAWSEMIDESEFIIADEKEQAEILNDKRGQLIIGSHFGNLEYCRGFMQRFQARQINVLLYDRHAANYVRVMQKISHESRINVYQVDELDIPIILQLKQKIEQGEWLFIAGDRLPLSGHERTSEVTFMGKPAALPQGPYLLARTLGCPVRTMFSSRDKEGVYFSVKCFSEKITLPTKNRADYIQKLAQRYAEELEEQCKRAPFQWFNFYPFWKKEKQQ